MQPNGQRIHAEEQGVRKGEERRGHEADLAGNGADLAGMWQRAELVMGREGMRKMGEQRVILFGVGGVGGWCAEALVRSGIQRLTIVDADRVSVSNINRQLMATSKTVGQIKVEALRQRLLDINPEAEIEAIHEVYSATNRERFRLEEYDFIIDAIDSLPDKADLILTATGLRGVTLVSSMGAALKMDPTRVRVGEFWSVTGDPLARALRQRFKREQRFPRRKFRCVYSDELLSNQPIEGVDEGPSLFKKPANGSLVHITAIFGMMLAGLVISDIWKQAQREGK